MNKDNAKTLIIHLKRAEQRRQHVNVLLKTLPLSPEVIEGVDGQKLSKADLEQFYRPKLYRPFYPFALSINEMACFLSHRKAWSHIVENKLDYAFIVEDDVAFDTMFDQIFAFAIKQVRKDSYIRLPIRNREKGRVLDQHGEVKLLAPTPVGLGTQAQLVGFKAAEILLEKTASFDRPVDTTLQLFWRNGVRPQAILPSCTQDISQAFGGSTLKQSHQSKPFLARELKRSLYRYKIKQLSNKFQRDR